MIHFNKLLIFFVITIGFFYGTDITAQSDWKYDAGVYGWFSAIEGTVGIANQDQQFDATVSDLLKNLKFSAGGHFEARNSKLSLIADIFFASLGNDAEIERTVGANTRLIDTTFSKNAEVNLDEWIVEGAVGYRVTDVFELLVASRLYSMDVSMLVEEQEIGSANKTWADIYIGARYVIDFAKGLYTSVRADIGTGGSTLSWFGNVALGYRFSELFSLALNYRILSLDYESGEGIDYFKYDAITSGFGLAAVFSF